MVKKLTVFILGFSIFVSTGKAQDSDGLYIFYNGDILTMQGVSPQYSEALVVRNGIIERLGIYDSIREVFPEARLRNLNGATLLPGFIDGHCHFAAFPGQAIGAQILPPPDAGASSIPKLIEILKDWSTPENLELTGWIFGMGFDDSVLEEKRFPTRHDLDLVSLENPVMIIHISGHFASVNSKALEILGIDKNSEDPVGGIIRREEDGYTPNGVLEELAAIPLMSQVLAPKSEKAILAFLNSGQDMALSYGYTTAQEGRAMKSTHDFLSFAAENKLLKLDVVSYVDYSATEELMKTKWNSSSYQNHYRIGGIKVTLDGSPQGRTAWKTIPYLIPPAGRDSTYRGYPALPEKYARLIYQKALKNNWQVLCHANGDAAIDQMIRCLETAEYEGSLKERRNVLIHGQYIRMDQLDKLKELGIIASLFPLHTFYWGDWHRQLIGDSLVEFISPTQTAIDKGIDITIHTDAPVALPNLMRLVWTAVQRESRSGKIVGANQRLSVYQALQCVTIWSAYQHFEESQKGSLVPGKIADLVVLSANPLKVPTNDIPKIQVLETIKNGKTIYKRTP